MDKIKEYIEKYDTIIIHGHVRPDGDCIGSQYSDYVAFIGRPELVSEELFKGALSICVDCATAERLSDKRYNLAEEYIKIDHHIPVEDYGAYQYVDTKAPACAQIIAELYLKNKDKWVLTKEAATALYVGILTDTSRFKFETVTSQTFKVAAELVDKGVDLGYLDNQLSVETLENLKLRGYVLSNFKITENGFAYITLTREEIERFGVSDEDAAAQVSTISSIGFCPVWAILLEYSKEEIRIRLRSRGPIINKLAEEYEGGGHAKASGAKLRNWSLLAEFVNKADKLVKEYKESLN